MAAWTYDQGGIAYDRAGLQYDGPAPSAVGGISSGGIPVSLSDWLRERDRRLAGRPLPATVRCEPGRLRPRGMAVRCAAGRLRVSPNVVQWAPARLAFRGADPAAVTGTAAGLAPGVVRWYGRESAALAARRRYEEELLLLGD